MADIPKVPDDLPMEPRHAGGRPSKYEPSYASRAREYGRAGCLSRAAMCAKLDIAQTTMDRWERENEEFRLAMEEAQQLAQEWWEEQGRVGMTAGSGNFNAAIWSRAMSARFSRDWRDRHIKIELPKVTDAASLLRAQTKVVEAVGNGDLDTEGATVLLKGFAELGTSMERMDIEKRLAAIEERLGSKR